MAPELIKQDVKTLSRLPEHLSVILELKGGDRGCGGLETLMDEVAELSAWCTCVGIPMLSIYEKTGTNGMDAHFLGRSLTVRRRLEGLPADYGSGCI